MNERTLKALEGSVRHWDMICMGLEVSKGDENCPLCMEFYIEGDECNSCDGCPAGRFCEETPYDGILRSRSKGKYIGELKELIRPAEQELEFLFNLLPEDHRWRSL